MEKVTRRNFLKGLGITGAAVAATAAMGCTTPSESSSESDGTLADTSDRSGAALSPHGWENAPEPIAADQIAEAVDVDVLVIGAGTAGVCAAHSANEAGAKVLVLEKTDSISARGHDVGVLNSKAQLEAGLEIDPVEVREYYGRLTSNKVNMGLFNVWIDHSGEALDHWCEIMDSFNVPYVPGMVFNPSKLTVEDPTLREFPAAIDFGDGTTGQETEDGEALNHRFVRILADDAADHGVEFRFNAPAVQLIREGNGPVTGAIAQNADGTYVQVNAAKGVILATGGIDGNDDMMNMWAAYAAKANRLYPDVGGNTGDGICLGMWVGAGHQKTHAAAMGMPSAAAPSGPLANPRPTYGWLNVNNRGERYVNEEQADALAVNANIAQPGSIGWSVFDSDYAAKAAAMNERNVVEDNEELQAQFEQAIATGLMFKGDTIEELANNMGVPADTLVATVERYNSLCAKGVDADFGKSANYLTAIDVPPFYASQVKSSILVCPYGLNVDEHSRVCTPEDEPIEGLYAIGNVQGNFLTDNYPFLIPGISHGRCVTFGYVLGKALAKGQMI